MTGEQPTPNPPAESLVDAGTPDKKPEAYIAVHVANPPAGAIAEIAGDATAEWVGIGVGEILKTAMDRGLDPIAIQQAMQGRMMG